MNTIRLMSQNQWNVVNNLDHWAEKGLDCSAETRMKGHIQIFKDIMPDIVGGQEVNIQMQYFFKFYCMEENLPYTIIWGNMTPIIYRADKFELLDTEYVLYPAHVDGYEGGFCDAKSKSCNVGVFRNKADGKVFVFATTHLWWQSDQVLPGSSEVRRLQIKQAAGLIAKYQAKYSGCPAILVGERDIPEGAVRRFDRYCPDYYLVISDHAPVYIDLAL